MRLYLLGLFFLVLFGCTSSKVSSTKHTIKSKIEVLGRYDYDSRDNKSGKGRIEGVVIDLLTKDSLKSMVYIDGELYSFTSGNGEFLLYLTEGIHNICFKHHMRGNVCTDSLEIKRGESIQMWVGMGATLVY